MYIFMYLDYNLFVIFFFKQKTAYEMRISDWSSDVCSSDLWPWSPGRRFRAGHRKGLYNPRWLGPFPDRAGQRYWRAAGYTRSRIWRQYRAQAALRLVRRRAGSPIGGGKHGRASCRERVWQYV